MRSFWKYTGRSSIITDTTTYWNKMALSQQENLILVQHSLKNYLTFRPVKEFFAGYHKWKIIKKCFKLCKL